MTHAVTGAQMSSAAINDLPDSAFAYIEPGGTKDEQGRTVPRSLRHFPIHDEPHVRNALARAPQSPFGDKAMPKIRAAARRLGIRVADQVTAAAELRDVELARPGTWKLASGPLTVTPRMLDDAARFANRDGARPAYLKIGHTDKRFAPGDGEPALGWVHNVRVEQDDQDHVLKGDLAGMPEWLAAAMPHHWPDRSIEGWADYEHDGEKYGLVVEALALLGITPPGMSSIRSLRDLPGALGVAASGPLEPSGTRIVASFGDTTVPAAEAVAPSPNQGVRMSNLDKAKIREALGLDPDASDDEVRTAFDAEIAPPEGAPAPVAAGAAPGTVVLASSTYEQLQRDIKVLTDHVAKTKRDERDEVIAKAVQAGKFTPAQKLHFSRLWDADPDGTRNLIDTLTPNSALAVVASGYAGEGVEADPEYSALYGAPDARKAG